MSRFPENLGTLLRLRNADLSAVATQCACTVETLEQWAAGTATPSLDQLVPLADALQSSLRSLLDGSIRSLPKGIRLLVLDVDGVMTDGGIYLTESGDEYKKFHARDGRGIMSAQKNGIEVAFLSGGVRSEAIHARAHRLGVKRCYVGKEPKTEVLEAWLRDSRLEYSQVAYIGDDANDLGVIAKVGYSACPADAAIRNREAVDLVLRLPGGQGCVREFIEQHLGIEVD